MGKMGGPGGNGFTGDSSRFRSDFGSESDDGVPPSGGGAPWLGAINTDISMPMNFGNFRIRMSLNQEDADMSVDKAVAVRYSINGSGFFDIQVGINHNYIGRFRSKSESLGVEPLSDSTEYFGAEALFSGTWADVTNGYIVTDNNFDRTGNAHYDQAVFHGLSTEWCLQLLARGVSGPSFDLVAGDTLDFRLYVDNQIFTGGYPNTPRINVTAALDNPVPYFLKGHRAQMMRQATR